MKLLPKFALTASAASISCDSHSSNDFGRGSGR